MKRTLIKTRRFRIQWSPNWRAKPRPWYFRATYPTHPDSRRGRSGTIQVTGLEAWW